MHNDNKQSLGAIFENIIDIFLNFGAVLMAYMFAVPILAPVRLVTDSTETTLSVFVIVILQSFVFMIFNLYGAVPFFRTKSVLKKILKVNICYYLAMEALILIIMNGEDKDFAILWVAFAGVISTGILLFKKRMVIRFAVLFKKKSYSLRRVIIIGDNTHAAEEFLRAVSDREDSGMMVIGYVGDKIHPDVGCDKLGSFRELSRVLDEYHPSDVVFAIDAYDKRHLIKLVNICDDHCVKVYFLPVIYGFFKSARQIEPVGSLPVINIHSTPLDSRFNAFIKRAIDILGSFVLILLTSPIMILAAIGVRISSPGPIFFKQERVGSLGRTFKMLKFRSMRVNAASDVSWSQKGDPRKTKFGSFIRMTSIDELPQLFNVLKGDMSLVGPRPEVPHFVDYFRERIPLYMVKHYVKPGMTGLAQIRGLRGDTSVEDRIHADIEYIENWSLGLDIAILLKTPFKAINKAERYTTPEESADDACESAPSGTDAAEPVLDTETVIKDECAADTHTADGNEAADEPIADSSDALESLDGESAPDGEVKPARGKKILYAASNMVHINNFHLGYIEALRADGYEVKVMARGEGADYNVPFEKKLFSSANTACRAEIARIVAAEKFDIIILNTSLAAFHIRFALPRKNRPRVVNIVHGYLFSRNTGFIKKQLLLTVEKLVASRTDKIIVMNDDDYAIATRHHLAREGVVMSHGMGVTRRKPETSPEKLRRELGCQDKYVLAFVGELSSRKNQQFLITAMNEIKERIPNAVLWLVGEGNERGFLEKLARDVDLSESVMLLGHRTDAIDLMHACDLYVSASMIEGMPFNVIEAMSCGKTVLASAVKGHTDLIEDGRTGFLFKYGSIKSFVDRAVDIHAGVLRVDPADVTAKFEEYSHERVFGETYRLMKESFE